MDFRGIRGLREMLKGYIRRQVDLFLQKKIDVERAILPSGFHPADIVRGAISSWLALPWGNKFVICKLRVLGAGEFPDVGLIDLSKKHTQKPDYETKAKLIDLQLEYCKKSLVSPTYEELISYILEELPTVKEGYEAWKRIEAQIPNMQKDEYTEKLETIRELALQYGCLLPFNFISAVASWCECLDTTNIKELTAEKLINAFAMSRINRNRPSDNLRGIFLDRARMEIDVLSAKLYQEQEKKK